MANYFFDVHVISRSAGRSVIAAAAYRSAERLKDRQTGKVHDYRNKQGVVHSEILRPESSAAFLGNRDRLWNYATSLETRRDAQLARDVVMACHAPKPANGTAELNSTIGARNGQTIKTGRWPVLVIRHGWITGTYRRNWLTQRSGMISAPSRFWTGNRNCAWDHRRAITKRSTYRLVNNPPARSRAAS